MLINPKTQLLLSAFIAKPSSSLILAGPSTSGVDAITRMLTEKILGVTHRNNVVTVTLGDTRTIGVEQIRELKKSLTTSASKEGIGRIAVVYNAETMTIEAQNALLKMIEEPAKGSIIVLVTSNAQELIDTISSRCQTITVFPITREQADECPDAESHSDSEVARAFMLSGGQSALFESLLSGQETAMTETINVAKKFLAAEVFDRLQQQKEYADAAKLHKLLEGLHVIAEAAMHSAQPTKVSRWKNILQRTKQSQKSLNTATAPKLVYLQLCVEL